MDSDLVATWTNSEGVPRRFQWRDRVWVVSGHPVPWTKRPPWWGDATQSGTVMTLIQRVWRVIGLNTASGETVTVDLAVEETGWCRLSLVEG